MARFAGSSVCPLLRGRIWSRVGLLSAVIGSPQYGHGEPIAARSTAFNYPAAAASVMPMSPHRDQAAALSSLGHAFA